MSGRRELSEPAHVSSGLRFETCPCCGAAEFRPAWTNPAPTEIHSWKDFFYGSFRFMPDLTECAVCRYRFINGVSTEWFRFYDEQDVSVYLDLSAHRLRHFEKMKAAVVEQLGDRRPASMLDIGCADGAWLSLWPEVPLRFGTEYSAKFREILRGRGLTVIEEGAIDDGAYGIVSMFDLLEHVPDPVAQVSGTWKTVMPGGALIVSVPDFGKWVARLFGRRYYLVCPMHFSYFGRFGLRRLLERTCVGGAVHLFPAPPMGFNLGGALKWLGVTRALPQAVNLSPGFGYSANLVAVVVKDS